MLTTFYKNSIEGGNRTLGFLSTRCRRRFGNKWGLQVLRINFLWGVSHEGVRVYRCVHCTRLLDYFTRKQPPLPPSMKRTLVH